MAEYLALAGIAMATGLAFAGAAWLFVRAVKYTRGSSPLVARLLVSLAVLFGLTVVAGAHVMLPLSVEKLRLFIKSGWGPLLWWAVCLLATWIPSMNYMSRQLSGKRASGLRSGRSAA